MQTISSIVAHPGRIRPTNRISGTIKTAWS
jgi:hypothetical protein